MKKYRASLVLVIVFAGLLGCYLYFNPVQKAAENHGIVEAGAGGIMGIEVTGPNGALKFSKQNNQWTMSEPFPYRLDQQKMLYLEESLHNLTPLRIVEKKAKDLSKYGLDQPALIISFKTVNGETRTLLIGAETVSKNNYYSLVENRNDVFTLNKSDIEGFQGQPSDFRDRNVIAMKPADVVSLKLNLKNQAFQLARDNTSGWRLVSPVKANVKSGAIKGFLEMIGDLRIRDFISEKPNDLQVYGLDHPLGILTVASEKMTRSIFFGKEDAEKECIFIKIDGNDAVYTLSNKDFILAQLKVDPFLDVAPLSVGIGDVREIKVIDRGKTAELSRATSQSDEDIFTLSGKTINNGDFNTFYINIMALSAAGYDSGNKGGSPEFSIVLTRKRGRTLQADFSPRDQTSLYMTINGKPLPYYVTAEKIMLVRKWLQRVQTAN